MDLLHVKWELVYPEPGRDSIMGMKADKTAAGCLKGLRDYNVLAFPVTDPEDEYKVIGVVDMVDVCAFVLDFWNDFAGITTERTFGDLLEKKLKDKTVRDLMNYSRANSFHPIDNKGTFKQVLEALTLPGVHRVPMLTKKSQFGRFVTQSEVLKFMSQNLDDFGPILEKTLIEAGVGTLRVKKIHRSSAAIDAFKVLVENKVSAVPVVDDDDRIVGVVSVRDVRLLVGAHANAELRQPLDKFLEHIRQGGSVPPRAIVGTHSDHVRDVITRIHSNRIHRIFLVDAHNRVAGVVSIGDIFKFILAQESTYVPPKKEERNKADEEAKKEAEKRRKKELAQHEKLLKKYVARAMDSSDDTNSD